MTALMVSNSFAREMEAALAAVCAGVQPKAIKVERSPRVLSAAPSGAADSVRANGYYLVGSVAVMCIDGPIWLEDSWMMDWFGGCTVGHIARSCEAMRNDAKVSRVAVLYASPGGTALQMEAVDAMRRLVAAKPVHAMGAPICCSAAYFLACLADEVAVTPDCIIGSVGTRQGGTMFDISKMLDDEGVKAYMRTTGKHKTTGAMGLPIDAEQIAQVDEEIESLFELFGGAVAERRGTSMDRIRAMQGAVYVGARGVAMGLADRVVATADEFVRELAGMAPGVRAERAAPPAIDQDTPDEPTPDAPEPDEPTSQEQVMATNAAGAAPGTADGKNGTEARGAEASTPQNPGAGGGGGGGGGGGAGPASFQQLEQVAANLPEEARDSFIVASQKKGHSVEQATTAAFAAMNGLISRAREQGNAATAAAAAAKANEDALGGEGNGVRAPGVSAGGGAGAGGGGADTLGIASCKTYDEAVSLVTLKKNVSRTEAVKQINATPQGAALREAMSARR